MQLYAKPTRFTCQVYSPQTSHAPPRRDRGVRTHASTSLLRVSAEVLCLAGRRDWCSRGLNIILNLEGARIGPAWTVSYFADQLTL